VTEHPDVTDESGTTGTDPITEGLRERKKRLTRQLLSDTATMLFLERGFDGFKITEVAEACGVSEKTVYNYFPTKESLILDREEDMVDAIRRALSDTEKSPVDAIADILLEERRRMREGMADLGSEDAGLAMFRRFMAGIAATPSLATALAESFDRMSRLCAECLAERAGVSPDDPEPLIAGRSLMGLWEVQRRALVRDDPADTSAADVYARAEDEVRRAARLINTGLWSFAAGTPGANSREQMKAAAEGAQSAGKQVAAALKHARKVWEEARAYAESHGGGTEGWAASWDDWNEWMPTDADLSSREGRQQWRESQREYVQRWREAQREQAQQWKQAAQTFKEEQREATRQLKEELKAAHRVHQDELRRQR
jgi:AcrR family transcriptional regulator